MGEREAKVKAIQNVINTELWVTPWNTKEMAEKVLDAITQVELDIEQDMRVREFAN